MFRLYNSHHQANVERRLGTYNVRTMLDPIGIPHIAQFHRACLEAVIKNLHETYQCRMYSRKLLMMGREDARNM
jgi:hypothetical protein